MVHTKCVLGKWLTFLVLAKIAAGSLVFGAPSDEFEKRVSVGIKAGVPLTDLFKFDIGSYQVETKRYAIGPVVDIRVWRKVGIETGAMYKRVGQQTQFSFVIVPCSDEECTNGVVGALRSFCSGPKLGVSGCRPVSPFMALDATVRGRGLFLQSPDEYLHVARPHQLSSRSSGSTTPAPIDKSYRALVRGRSGDHASQYSCDPGTSVYTIQRACTAFSKWPVAFRSWSGCATSWVLSPQLQFRRFSRWIHVLNLFRRSTLLLKSCGSVPSVCSL